MKNVVKRDRHADRQDEQTDHNPGALPEFGPFLDRDRPFPGNGKTHYACRHQPACQRRNEQFDKFKQRMLDCHFREMDGAVLCLGNGDQHPDKPGSHYCRFGFTQVNGFLADYQAVSQNKNDQRHYPCPVSGQV